MNNTIKLLLQNENKVVIFIGSGSYEDSLKSLHQNIGSGHIPHKTLMRGNGHSTRRRQRHNSLSGEVSLVPDIQQQPTKQQQLKSGMHIAPPTSSLVRRASERSCQMNDS